jgi:hypothetical protein
MGYRKFCYWVEAPRLRQIQESMERSGIQLSEEVHVPCRVLRASRQLGYVAPAAWNGFCRTRTSWYWKSDKAGKSLVASRDPLGMVDSERPVTITESSFEPDHLPTYDEIRQLTQSEDFKKLRPGEWDTLDPLEKDFYQKWFERERPGEPFNFDQILLSHAANHANFLDPRFFATRDGTKAPYSIADSIHVCSSCLEFFNILGDAWPVKYVVPCVGAVQFAHLPMNHYLKVGIVQPGG